MDLEKALPSQGLARHRRHRQQELIPPVQLQHPPFPAPHLRLHLPGRLEEFLGVLIPRCHLVVELAHLVFYIASLVILDVQMIYIIQVSDRILFGALNLLDCQ